MGKFHRPRPLWVLDCGSPLPLFCPTVSRLPERQRAGALQDAAATKLLKFVCRAGILSRRDGRNGRAFSSVPPGLDAQSNPIPALKRRAVFRLSLRDKLVCAMFILISTSSRASGGKSLILFFQKPRVMNHIVVGFLLNPE